MCGDLLHMLTSAMIKTGSLPLGEGHVRSFLFGLIFGAVGAVASGYLWEYSAQTSYMLASVVSLLALVLVWRYVIDDE